MESWLGQNLGPSHGHCDRAWVFLGSFLDCAGLSTSEVLICHSGPNPEFTSPTAQGCSTPQGPCTPTPTPPVPQLSPVKQSQDCPSWVGVLGVSREWIGNPKLVGLVLLFSARELPYPHTLANSVGFPGRPRLRDGKGRVPRGRRVMGAPWGPSWPLAGLFPTHLWAPGAPPTGASQWDAV